MKIEEINTYIDKLNWNCSQDENELAINNLIHIDEDKMHMLLQPRHMKCYWDNAAIVIKQIGYPRIKHIIMGKIKSIGLGNIGEIIDFLIFNK